MSYKNVDLTYLKKNSGGNPLFIKELIQAFLKNEANYIIELKQIFLERDQEKFNFYCHKMSSNYATFGAAQMLEMIEQIKNIDLRKSNTDETDRLLEKARDLHNRIQSELLDVLKTI